MERKSGEESTKKNAKNEHEEGDKGPGVGRGERLVLPQDMETQRKNSRWEEGQKGTNH